jgi:hypothetical protein
MSFSTDENALNSINLDSVTQYKQFIEQLKPLMLDQSGYQEVGDSNYNEGLSVLQSQLEQNQNLLSTYQKEQARINSIAPKDRTAEDNKVLGVAK